MSAEMSKANKAASLGEGSVPGLVLRFAATTFAALLLNSVYSLTDALFVSWRVGENAMGGISLVFPFVVLQGAISTAVGSGAASVVSRKLGQGDPRAAGEATQTARAVFYLSALLISIIGLLLLDPLLSFMGATPELYLPAKQYFTILLLGNVFSTGFSSIIRAEGNMLYGLLIWVIPISVNIGLDALFILTFNWGIQGSAAATVLSQFLSAMMSVLFFRKLSVQDFKNARPHLKTAGEILAVGVPSLVQMGSLSLATLVLNRVLSETGGTAGVNAFAYISKILTVAVLPFTAVAQAVAPIAGYSFGAGQRRRIQKTFRFGLLLSFLYALLSFGVLCAAPTAFLRLFTDDAGVLEPGTAGLRVIAVSLWFLPLPLLLASVLQAAGKKLWSLLLYGASSVLLLPIAWLFAKRFGVSGVWWAYVVSNFAATLLAAGKLAFMKQKTV